MSISYTTPTVSQILNLVKELGETLGTHDTEVQQLLGQINGALVGLGNTQQFEFGQLNTKIDNLLTALGNVTSVKHVVRGTVTIPQNQEEVVVTIPAVVMAKTVVHHDHLTFAVSGVGEGSTNLVSELISATQVRFSRQYNLDQDATVYYQIIEYQ